LWVKYREIQCKVQCLLRALSSVDHSFGNFCTVKGQVETVQDVYLDSTSALVSSISILDVQYACMCHPLNVL
jgi:hypothetical protein